MNLGEITLQGKHLILGQTITIFCNRFGAVRRGILREIEVLPSRGGRGASSVKLTLQDAVWPEQTILCWPRFLGNEVNGLKEEKS